MTQGGFFWTSAGCPRPTKQVLNTNAKVNTATRLRGATCMHETQSAAVRCCDAQSCTSVCEARKGTAHAPRSPGVRGTAASWSEAARECALIGKRLCTHAELSSSRCCRSGCSMDTQLVWSSDACSHEVCKAHTRVTRPSTVLLQAQAHAHCSPQWRGRLTPGDTSWCQTSPREPLEADVLICGEIASTLGESLAVFRALATFVRALSQHRPELRVALQLPMLSDEAGGGEGQGWPLLQLY